MATGQLDHPASPAREWGLQTARRLRASRLAALGLTVGMVAVSTLVVNVLTPHVPVDSAGVFYLVAVLAASSLYGLWWGLATSLLSAFAFNFFFLPPAHTLVIDSSGDWLALAAFAVTAVVTSDLAARERSNRDEAAQRATEARLGERFATLVAEAPDLESVLPELAREAAQALGASDGIITRDREQAHPDGVLLELSGRLVGELRLVGGPPDVAQSAPAERVGRSLASLIVLGEERERRRGQQVHAEALARSNELKTALLRAVSHDLRSPLMAITTAAGGLRYADLDEDDRELLQTISEQSDRMSRMIDDLLDLSRLTAGALEPAADWIDPRELAEAAIEESVTGEEESRVTLAVGHDLPLVRGDEPQLKRVLVNLIENALKFSPAESVVTVSIEETPATVDMAVADAGCGIPAEDLTTIFEPFYRSRSHAGVPGSGLGLAVAMGLAVANGCTLTVTSEPGRGSRFVLGVPRDPQEQA